VKKPRLSRNVNDIYKKDWLVQYKRRHDDSIKTLKSTVFEAKGGSLEDYAQTFRDKQCLALEGEILSILADMIPNEDWPLAGDQLLYDPSKVKLEGKQPEKEGPDVYFTGHYYIHFKMTGEKKYPPLSESELKGWKYQNKKSLGPESAEKAISTSYRSEKRISAPEAFLAAAKVKNHPNVTRVVLLMEMETLPASGKVEYGNELIEGLAQLKVK